MSHVLPDSRKINHKSPSFTPSPSPSLRDRTLQTNVVKFDITNNPNIFAKQTLSKSVYQHSPVHSKEPCICIHAYAFTAKRALQIRTRLLSNFIYKKSPIFTVKLYSKRAVCMITTILELSVDTEMCEAHVLKERERGRVEEMRGRFGIGLV
jgi:hypothetical protein